MSLRKRGDSKPSNGTVKGLDNVVDVRTDHMRWRLKDENGRQTWHFLKTDEEVKAWPMTVADKYFLGMDTV